MKVVIILGVLGMLLLTACSITGNVVTDNRTGYCDYREFQGQTVYFCKPIRMCNWNNECSFLNEENIKGKCIDHMCLRYCIEEKTIEC